MLTEHLVDKEGTPTRAALDQTLTFFREKLGVGGRGTRGPRPEAASGPGDAGAVGLRGLMPAQVVDQSPAGSPRTHARPSAPRRPSPRTTSTPSRCRPSAAGRPARAAAARTGSARPWGSGPWSTPASTAPRPSSARGPRAASAAFGPEPGGEHVQEHGAALGLAQGRQRPGPGPGRVAGRRRPGRGRGWRGVERDLDGVVGGDGGARDPVVRARRARRRPPPSSPRCRRASGGSRSAWSAGSTGSKRMPAARARGSASTTRRADTVPPAPVTSTRSCCWRHAGHRGPEHDGVAELGRHGVGHLRPRRPRTGSPGSRRRCSSATRPRRPSGRGRAS